MTLSAPRRAHITALAAAAVLIASACTGALGVAPTEQGAPAAASTTDASPGNTEPVHQSAYGGTVVVGFADGGAPRSLNPFIDSPDAPVLDMLAPALFAQAYDVDPQGGVRIPDTFAVLPSIEAGTIVDNGDGTQDVTVEIVAGARWADGAPITAEDLEFTYQLATDPSLPIRTAVAKLYAAVVPGSVRADGRTLSFRMSAGADPTDLFSIIVPRHAVEVSDFSRDWNDRIWVSGGPFVLSDWQPGQFVELSRNENYWKVTQAEGAPLPFLDRIVIRFFEPGDLLDPRLVDGFERSEVDVAVFGHAESRIESFAVATSDGAIVATTSSGEWEHLNFQFGPANRNSASANASATFRRAIATAIDRAALAGGRGTSVAHSILAQFVPGLGEQPFAAYAFDPEGSAEAIGSGGPAVLLTVPGDDPATITLGGDIVTMLRDVGFEAELQLEDASLFFGTTLDTGSWDVSTWRFGAGSGLGAAIAFMRFFDPDGLPFVGDNYFRWGTVDSTVQNNSTERYGEIIDALDRAVAPETMRSLLIEAEAILAEQAVILPLMLSGDIGLAHWPDTVVGVTINRVQGPLWNVDTWRIPTE